MKQAIHNIPEYEVSQFNTVFKEVVETNFDYVRIRGEISELKKASSGHIYLTLKDDSSILNATIWSQKKNYLNLQPEIGMDVIVTGKISTYAKSISTYSINIDKIEIAGEGSLLKLIEERKIKLRKKGIFDEKYKKPLPYLPNKIGVITSSTGSVIHDILNRIKDRFPVKIDIWPVSVQGINSAQDICKALDGFSKFEDFERPDVIIIARGGGSVEDLMPFNDEELAIKVFEFSIPIISAIGHETDTTIIDFCSDLRVSTPTAAAEKAVPMRTELIQLILNFNQRLNYSQENELNNAKVKLKNLSQLLKAPNFVIDSYKDKINFVSKNLFMKLENIIKNYFNLLENYEKLIRFPGNDIVNMKTNLNNLFKVLEKIFFDYRTLQKKELNKFFRLLESNSIHLNLQKGYSIIKKSNKIINKSKEIIQDDIIDIQFLDKKINVNIKKIN